MPWRKLNMKVELKEKTLGFTERDINSKAILNTDVGALLKYKIQKYRSEKIRESAAELSKVKSDINNIRNELCEIKNLLLKITTRE